MWSRAALGAVGAWWVLLAEPLLDRRLLLGVVDPPSQRWFGSASRALDRVLEPVLTSPGLALCAVWAVAAAVLPLLVRGRAAAVDMVLAAGWAGALGAATSAVAQAAGAPEPRGLVLGAFAAGVVAVAARAVRPRDRPPSGQPEDRPYDGPQR
jgi:hypothetical protein